MTIRLDPRRPVLWRTPHSLQVGVDDAVLLDSVRTETEQIVAALRAGFPAEVESRLPDTFDIAEAEFERVLTTLDPLIERTPAASGRAEAFRVAVEGSSHSAELLRRLLAEQGSVGLPSPDDRASAAAGHEDASAGGAVDAAVLFADFVLPPSRYARWLREDVPHLPVVFSDRVVRIGPFVTPGSGPCLHCVELHHADDDPSWPAVASQLLGRRSPLDGLLLGAEVATRVARLLLRRLEASHPALASTQLVLDAATGGVRRRVVREHSMCACRALPGSATAPVGPRVAASPTMTGSGTASRG